MAGFGRVDSYLCLVGNTDYLNYSNLKEELKELDTFKMMLIKNQSDIIDNHKIISDLNKKVEDINKQQDKDDQLEEFYNHLNTK